MHDTRVVYDDQGRLIGLQGRTTPRQLRQQFNDLRATLEGDDS